MTRIFFTIILIALTTKNTLANSPNLRDEYTATAIPAHNLTNMPIAGLPKPRILITNINRLPTKIIPQTTLNDGKVLDVTLIDDFIDDVAPNARHYPPNFPNRTAQYHTAQTIKYLADWFEPYAQHPNASLEILLRAVQINAMGRNMDLGAEYGVRASTYVNTILEKDRNHTEANYLYGIMLSEGGGFNEGQHYLQIAANQGLVEAEQSLAQIDLLTDKTDAALSRLQSLGNRYPNNTQIKEQIHIVENGGYYIWDIKDGDIHVKPIQK